MILIEIYLKFKILKAYLLEELEYIMQDFFLLWKKLLKFYLQTVIWKLYLQLRLLQLV